MKMKIIKDWLTPNNFNSTKKKDLPHSMRREKNRSYLREETLSLKSFGTSPKPKKLSKIYLKTKGTS